MTKNQLEFEVKFFLEDPRDVAVRLISMGARDQGRVFESNTCYDTPQKTIISANRLLRLRLDDACRLTLKSKSPANESEVKANRELEVEVSNFETMQAILNDLGFYPVRVYEKWRRTFTMEGTSLCLDTMPYGEFIEIEGEKSSIRHIAAKLELDWDKRIVSNYLAIFDLIREKAALPFTDPTFAHFLHYPISIEPYLAALEAGK